MSREAMQAALDALTYHQEQTRPIQRTIEAIAQLEAALAAPVEPVAYVYLDRWNSGRAWPDDCFSGTRCDGQVPVYLAAPVSGRVISDAEILDALRSIDVETKRLPEGLRLFARAIIAKVEGK